MTIWPTTDILCYHFLGDRCSELAQDSERQRQHCSDTNGWPTTSGNRSRESMKTSVTHTFARVVGTYSIREQRMLW